MSKSPVPLSVVIPTIGRADLLERCLQSIAACEPLPAEVVVVDQSGGSEVTNIVGRFSDMGARVVKNDRRSVAVGRNVGLRSARYDAVLITDDDCRVAPSWVAAAWAHMAANPEAIITGRVAPGGDARGVPSTKDDPEPHDYTGETQCYVLYPNNMGLSRSAVLGFGGFDDRVEGAEDNDFCYLWLRAGRTLRYEPDVVVWHDDWRSADELRSLFAAYARAQGVFYAKHLRNGDPVARRMLLGEMTAAFRRMTTVQRGPRRADLPRLLFGLVSGWRRFSPASGRGRR